MNGTPSPPSEPAPTIPPDDPRRTLAIARPDDQSLPHVAVAGNTSPWRGQDQPPAGHHGRAREPARRTERGRRASDQ